MLKTASWQFIDIECYKNYFLLIAFGSGNKNSYRIKQYIKADINHNQRRKSRLLKGMDYHKFEIISCDIPTDHGATLTALIEFMKGKTLVAHNGNGYDFVLLDYIAFKIDHLRYVSTEQACKDIHDLSDMIIHNHDIWIYQLHPDLLQSRYAKWKRSFNAVDTLKSLFEGVNRKSAKQTAIMLKWHRIQDLPIEPNAIIELSDTFDLVDYCINDTLIVHKFFYHKIDEVRLKIRAKDKFNIKNALNLNRSALADAYLMKRYEEETGESQYQFKDGRTIRNRIALKDLILNKVKFKSKLFNDLFIEINNTVIDADKLFNKTFICNGTKYTIATGGLHSNDTPGILLSTDKYLYRDADGTSYYPVTVIENNICPKHVNSAAFIRIFGELVTFRINAKNDVKIFKSKAKTDILNQLILLDKARDAKLDGDFYKICINASGFGKFGFDGWLLDKAALYKVTINCQLLLLMLIERLELNGFHVVSANTDGIITKVYYDKEDHYYSICKEWSKDAGYNLEYTDYHKYVKRDVNNYIAIKTSFLDTHDEHDIKTKGIFHTELDVDKGYSMPIIAKALFAYYVHDIPVKEFLYNYKGDGIDPPIYDFCLSQKTGEQFYNEYQLLSDGVIQYIPLQKNIRYYVSNTGGCLFKVDKVPFTTKKGTVRTRTRILAGKYITIFNDYYKADITDYNINYSFYNSEIMAVINDISNIITKKMKTKSGTMFDELDDD